MRYGNGTKAWLLVVMLSLFPFTALATTWIPTKVRDPITNQNVQVQEPGSYGSYIYQWPGKADQVFWPYTDSHWLWFNPDSGYIAFGEDFAKLDPSQRPALEAWLKSHYNAGAPPQSRLELLRWAEKVYAARGMNDDFWSHFFRLMAFETQTDKEVSLGYLKRALPLLEKQLNASTDPGQTLGTLYLLSEYNRRLGREGDAKRYLDRLTSMEVDDKLSEFKQYLLGIAKEQQEAPSDEAVHHDAAGGDA